MDEMKRMIQRKLVANVLMEQCTRREHLIFRDAWCSQERVIRFATPFFRKLFSENPGGWESGDVVMYEVQNNHPEMHVECVCIPRGENFLLKRVAMLCGVSLSADRTVLKSWDISDEDVNQAIASFEHFADKILPFFEKDLEDKINQKDTFTEGEEKKVFTSRYERNPQARAACLAYHGYTCKVCGMNFEETYGPDLKDVIEVHHIVPLNQIGADYEVDPIRDLIPLCPNCHTAVHHKPEILSNVKFP